MKVVVVTDSNVFTLFFECNLLEALLSSNVIGISVPERVFEEITSFSDGYRIPREYPDIPPMIKKARHGGGNKEKVKITVKDIKTEINNPQAILAYFQLENNPEIDPGELEAISLAIELQADFISDDEAAVAELNTTYAGHGSVGKKIAQFIDDLEALNAFSKQGLRI